ncbi:hypothetical protein [Phaeodactylibacter sp.]|uniref:hypothetical protein n=1 Tax=Phaeodactylibacter sp. TaxID=1940289 RepID=UPI002600B184|nr:hypothetical protein [Phaeodactylibacter sp.]MCI4647135.1 hypothetical protein [Phaeodactylibacter sp.]MCI5093957.1 hypothetical protein [Phaeodactylibacter sp.]
MKKSILFLVFFAASLSVFSQEQYKGLLYFEADPLAYINQGYSIHLGYENWKWRTRFDLTTVRVDYPETFEDFLYGTTAFDLVIRIDGIKVDYLLNKKDLNKGAFVGVDINSTRLLLTHRETGGEEVINEVNIGIRGGYKLNIWKGFYITPWAALWLDAANEQEFVVGNDKISNPGWSWLVTAHLGYAYPLR